MLKKTVKDCLYGIKTTLLYSKDDEVIIDYLGKIMGKDYEDYLNGAGFFCSPDLFNFYIIINKHTIEWQKTLVHECLHVTSRALRARGLELTDESEEAFTYYHAWLVSELSRIFTNYKRSKPMKAKKNKMMPRADMAKKEAMKQDRKMMGKKMMKGKK